MGLLLYCIGFDWCRWFVSYFSQLIASISLIITQVFTQIINMQIIVDRLVQWTSYLINFTSVTLHIITYYIALPQKHIWPLNRWYFFLIILVFYTEILRKTQTNIDEWDNSSRNSINKSTENIFWSISKKEDFSGMNIFARNHRSRRTIDSSSWVKGILRDRRVQSWRPKRFHFLEFIQSKAKFHSPQIFC